MAPRILVLALLVLGAFGCADVSPSAPKEAAPAAIWLDESSPLFTAQQSWGMPLPWEPAVTTEFGTGNEVAAHCGFPDSSASACTMRESHEMLFQSGMTPDVFEAVAEHELGHILKGPHTEHIVDAELCPEPTNEASLAIMCTFGKHVPGLTDADFEFVLGATPAAE